MKTKILQRALDLACRNMTGRCIGCFLGENPCPFPTYNNRHIIGGPCTKRIKAHFLKEATKEAV